MTANSIDTRCSNSDKNRATLIKNGKCIAFDAQNVEILPKENTGI